jgi:ABC-type proline/glycine betaine transport system substrate-binding protein
LQTEPTDARFQWEWIRRFANRLVELCPVIWISTATAIAMLAINQDRELKPEEAAEKYVKSHQTPS